MGFQCDALVHTKAPKEWWECNGRFSDLDIYFNGINCFRGVNYRDYYLGPVDPKSSGDNLDRIFHKSFICQIES